VLRVLYQQYLLKYLPKIANYVASNPQAYVYLAESIRAWPDQKMLAEEITQQGYNSVSWRDLTFGIVALHRGRK
jgi:demethylmenaquinone methyltransferase/2-methoxy-6-polyprenyl-1,4-benzoquinol methylase